MNHIKPILALRDEFPNDIAISFSSADEREKLRREKPLVYERMQIVSRYLSEHKCLPDDVIAFLTTSRNKEGININNKDIHIMFVETHNDVDVIQMAGRLRNSADMLYVVADSIDFHDTDNRFEFPFSESSTLIKAINEHFCRLCTKEAFDLTSEYRRNVRTNKELADFIDYIHAKFPYIRYDYFTDLFQFYPERHMSKKYSAQQNRLYLDACTSSTNLIQLSKKRFPGSACSVSQRVSMVADSKQAVQAYLIECHWLDERVTIRSKERAEILQVINKITGYQAKTLRPVLKQFGYQLTPLTKSKDKDAPCRIVPIEEE